MIIKPTRQKQLPGSVLWKKCSQKFRKIGREKPVSDTVVFLSILQSFQKHLFYWTPPVAASSKFKGSGFTEAVMQMNFWITHDLVHLNTLSSSWHYCLFLASTSFQFFSCISTASLTFDIVYCFWKRRIEIRWYLDQSNSFCAKLYRSNHRIISILLSLQAIGPVVRSVTWLSRWGLLIIIHFGALGLVTVEIRFWFFKWPHDKCATWHGHPKSPHS